MEETILKYHGSVGEHIPKVYFCADTEDRKKYFDTVYNELATHGEFSLWYDERLSKPDEKEQRLELEQMHLFVIPVTARLLKENLGVIKNEYLFACEKSIPVLLIAFEKIDINLYTKEFGKRHYLEYNSSEVGALSFSEKFGKFISGIFVDPELFERIKTAFDGYIFLSYRKKDRLHLPRIMSLIHSNEELVNVAVWYDEFLTPGENFEKNIEKRLEECNTFLLAVTPNMLAENNYVVTKEYPFARQRNKPIVPVEVENTETERLERLFDDLPICIPITDARGVLETLKSKLNISSLNRSSGKLSDNERDYLIGLAYFSGIDIETDKKRALTLIEKAADAGLGEAMATLSSFYLKRVGVDREGAAERQQRYLELCRMTYEREGTAESVCAYADALEALANIEDSLLEYDDSCEATLNARPAPVSALLMVELLEKELEKGYNEVTLNRLLEAYSRIPGYYATTKMRGCQSGAYAYRAIDVLERVAQERPSSDIYEKLAGFYSSFTGDFDAHASEVVKNYEKALMYYRKAFGDDRSIRVLKEYYRLNHEIGDMIFTGRCNNEDGMLERHWLEALENLEEIYSKDPSEENAQTLCEAYLRYSEKHNDPLESYYAFDAQTRICLCEKAFAILSKHFKDMEDKTYAMRIKVLLCLFFADAYLETEDYADAFRFYDLVLRGVEKVTQDHLFRWHYRRSDVALNGNIGAFRSLAKLGRIEEAEEYAFTAIASGMTDVKKYPIFVDEWIEKRAAGSLCRFADNGLGSYADMVEERAKDNKYWCKRWRSEFAQRCYSAYEICSEVQNVDAASKYLSHSVSASIKDLTDDRQELFDIFQRYRKLGDLYMELEQSNRALICYRSCVACAIRLDNGKARIEDIRLLSAAYIKLGNYYVLTDQRDHAEKYYIKALKCSSRIFSINKNRDEFMKVYEILVDFYLREGNVFTVVKKILALRKILRENK